MHFVRETLWSAVCALRIIPIPFEQLVHERAIFPAQDLGVITRRSAKFGRQKAVVPQCKHTSRRNRYHRESLISDIRFLVAWYPAPYRQVPVFPIVTCSHWSYRRISFKFGLR